LLFLSGPETAGISYTDEGASWFFWSQISFEIIYFVSTMFLIKIFNEIVDKCVDSPSQNEDYEGRDFDLIVQGSFLSDSTHLSSHQSSNITEDEQPRPSLNETEQPRPASPGIPQVNAHHSLNLQPLKSRLSVKF
jgi:hypothetical protein